MYTVEYSVEQGCFHIDKLNQILETNIRMCVDRVSNDYKIIGIFDSHEKAVEFANKVKEKLK